MTALQELAESAGPTFEGADPRDVIAWAVDTFGDRLCLTSSMADAVLMHLATSVRPGLAVLFIDTGYHFGQTLATRDLVATSLAVNVVTVRPRQTVAEQDAGYGGRLYARDPDLCCSLRKVEPLDRALAGYDAWASGVRRDESASRRSTPVVGWDARRRKVKVNPLACWTKDDVDAYAAANDVIVNPLVPLGFPSIGCAPCTRRVAADEDVRAGRGSGLEKTECGLHV